MKFKILFTFFLSFSSTIAFAQKSATIKVTHFPGNTLVNGQSKFVAPNYIRVSTTNLNCFSFLDVAVYVKASGDKDKPYRYKVGITNNSPFEVNVTCSKWGFGNGGRSGIKSGATYSPSGNLSDERSLSITISDVDFDFSENEQQRYGVSTLSEKLNCNETPNSYLAKIQAKNKKKEKIKKLQEEIRSLGSSEAELIHKLALLKDLKDLDGNGNYDSKITSIEEQLERIKNERRKKKEEIGDLKNQISSLGNSKEDLLKKKSLYQKLETIDAENEYSTEINNIEEEIENLNEEEKEEKQQKLKADDSNTDNTAEDEETEEEKAEVEAKQKQLEEEQKLKEKQEAEERERKRKEEAERLRKEKIKAYNDRIESQRKENNAIAASAAASSASVLYLVGGIIYDKMGLPAKDLYTGNNFHVNFDIGYGFSVFPIANNSVKTGIDFNGNNTETTNNDPSTALTIDLRLALKFGYEMEYGGGNIFGRFEPGFSPVFTDFNTSYGYGIELFGGHKNFKLYGKYESGANSFSTSNWLDPEEIGEGGKSSTAYQQIRTGLKFSYYRNYRTAKRDHLIIGIMENYFDENSASIFGIRKDPDKPILNLLSTPSKADLNPYIATGYFFEWKRDHTHRLYVEMFPNYPITGEIGGHSNEGGFFIQVGFSRSIEAFFK